MLLLGSLVQLWFVTLPFMKQGRLASALGLRGAWWWVVSTAFAKCQVFWKKTKSIAAGSWKLSAPGEDVKRPHFLLWSYRLIGFPGHSDSKESACNVGDKDSIPGSGRSPGEGNGDPLQYSCLENPMDRGAWRATESQTQLSDSQVPSARMSSRSRKSGSGELMGVGRGKEK